MRLKDIYNLAVQTGIENDPRGQAKIDKILAGRKSNYERLSAKEKASYNKEKLIDPYSDSGIHFGDPETEVKRVLVGIDIGTGEILLAKELERMGKKVDLIIGHHPIGKAYTKLHEMMEIQTDVLVRAGIPENIAEKTLEERLGQVARGTASINHYQPVDMARLVEVPLLNFHTPADNCVWKFLDRCLVEQKPEMVGDIIDALKEIPEYRLAAELNAGPTIFSGEERHRAGKVIIDMTGGTSGSDRIYERMSHFGIGTVVTMHMHERSREEAAKHYINVVVAGHISSDSLGMNLILDKLEAAGVEIVPCSGLIRHSRNKK